MTDSDDNRLLEASEAVKYLAERWGVESYGIVAFRSLRFRHNIQPTLQAKNTTFWKKSDLDQIPKPDRSRPRGKRTRKSDTSKEGNSSSVRFTGARNYGRAFTRSVVR